MNKNNNALIKHLHIFIEIHVTNINCIHDYKNNMCKKYRKIKTPKENPEQQNYKMVQAREPVHGRYWQVQITVHVP